MLIQVTAAVSSGRFYRRWLATLAGERLTRLTDSQSRSQNGLSGSGQQIAIAGKLNLQTPPRYRAPRIIRSECETWIDGLIPRRRRRSVAYPGLA